MWSNVGTWIFEGAASVGLFLLALPLFLPVALAVLYRRYRFAAPVPTMWALLSALYASALVAFTTFPLPDAPQDFCTRRATYEYWRLTPGQSFREVLDKAAEVGLGATLTSGVFLQVAFNVVFFVPLGFLVAYLLGRGVWWALGLGLGTSLLIETAQGTALWGLYPCPFRVAEVDDLITNTTGALLGWVIGIGVARLLPFREPARRADLAPPFVRRRVLAAAVDLMVVFTVTLGIEVAVAFVLEVQGADPEAGRGVLKVLALVIPVVLLLGVPLLRRDRATVGQWVVMVGLVSAQSGGPTGAGAPVVRFAVRWLPMLVFGAPAYAIVAVLELTTVAVRKDRRSLAGSLGRTETRTHDAIEQLARERRQAIHA